MSAAWVHERGPQIAPPPPPPDQHALQSYFFDADSKQWIRTVLAPLGRDLAAKWQGAHKIPEGQVALSIKAAKARTQTEKKKSSPFGMVVVAVALLVLVGGVGVFASQSGMLASANATKSPDASTGSTTGTGAAGSTGTSGTPTVTEAPAPVVTAPPAATAEPVATNRPAPVVTAPPPANIPAGPRATLGEGTIVVYTGGVTSVTRGGFLPARFSLIAPNGRPASGELTIVLGDLTKDPRIVSGLLDANGRIALDIPATLPLGQYPLSIVYKGSRAQLATITIR